jgi:copper chaperone
MCGCSSRSATTASDTATFAGAVFKVEDMTCGHCAGVISKALTEALAGAAFTVDLAGQLVTVPTDAAGPAEEAMRDAGYEPRLLERP